MVAKTQTTARKPAVDKGGAPTPVIAALAEKVEDLSAKVAEFQDIAAHAAVLEGDTSGTTGNEGEPATTTPGTAIVPTGEPASVSQHINRLEAEKANQEAIGREADRAIGIGDNKPPVGREIISPDGKLSVIMPAGSTYTPTVFDYRGLESEVATLQQTLAVYRDTSHSFRQQLITLAVDYTLLRANRPGEIVVNGTPVPALLLTIDRDKPESVQAARRDISGFVRQVVQYNPQKEAHAPDGKNGVIRDSDNPNRTMTDASFDTTLNEAVNAAILVYFGAYGFTLANFTPNGNVVVTDDMIRQGTNYKRRLAYEMRTLVPNFLYSNVVTPTAPGIVPASSETVRRAWQVFIGKMTLDKFGKPVKKGRTPPPAQTETTEQKAARLAKEETDSSAALVKAGDAIGERAKLAGDATPEMKAAHETAIASDVLVAFPAAINKAFRNVGKESHDLALATRVAEGFKTLVDRLDWPSDRVKKNTALMEAIANVNMALSPVLDADNDDNL